MTKIKARLMPVKGGKALRTDFVEGYYTEDPHRGKGFKFYGEPLDSGKDLRQIYTSNVLKIEWMLDNKGFLIHTLTGSTYLVDIHED